MLQTRTAGIRTECMISELLKLPLDSGHKYLQTALCDGHSADLMNPCIQQM